MKVLQGAFVLCRTGSWAAVCNGLCFLCEAPTRTSLQHFLASSLLLLGASKQHLLKNSAPPKHIVPFSLQASCASINVSRFVTQQSVCTAGYWRIRLRARRRATAALLLLLPLCCWPAPQQHHTLLVLSAQDYLGSGLEVRRRWTGSDQRAEQQARTRAPVLTAPRCLLRFSPPTTGIAAAAAMALAARKKIVKDKGQVPDEFEEQVAQVRAATNGDGAAPRPQQSPCDRSACWRCRRCCGHTMGADQGPASSSKDGARAWRQQQRAAVAAAATAAAAARCSLLLAAQRALLRCCQL